MKGLTKKLKAESVKKWEGIYMRILGEIRGHYMHSYWRSCGFCTAALGSFFCNICELYTTDYRRKVVCYASKNIPSHTLLALEEADKGNFKKAEYHAAIVLEAIYNADEEEQ